MDTLYMDMLNANINEKMFMTMLCTNEITSLTNLK